MKRERPVLRLVASRGAGAHDPTEPGIAEVLVQIETANRKIRDFWSGAEGWAPIEAAKLLSKSRLDWQVSLSETLRLWLIGRGNDLSDGELILAWANLGSIVEGTMKLFLSVFYDDYISDVDAIRRRGGVVAPGGLTLERLRQFFTEKDLWTADWDQYVQQVQTRRNLIHAFEGGELGTAADFEQAVRRYLLLLHEINSRLPYPE